MPNAAASQVLDTMEISLPMKRKDAKGIEFQFEDKAELAIAVSSDNKSVMLSVKSQYKCYDGLILTLNSDAVVYIVNLLRGNILSKLTGQQSLLNSILDQYRSAFKDARFRELVSLMSNDANNVEDLIHELNGEDEQWTGFCNLIQMMATITRVALYENK